MSFALPGIRGCAASPVPGTIFCARTSARSFRASLESGDETRQDAADRRRGLSLTPTGAAVS